MGDGLRKGKKPVEINVTVVCPHAVTNALHVVPPAKLAGRFRGGDGCHGDREQRDLRYHGGLLISRQTTSALFAARAYSSWPITVFFFPCTIREASGGSKRCSAAFIFEEIRQIFA